MGFDTEDNKRGYRMFDEEYLEWDNATRKCQELGARLPVLSDQETIKIVKKYLATADFDVFEVIIVVYFFYIYLSVLYLPSNGTDLAGGCGWACSTPLARGSPGWTGRGWWPIQPPVASSSGRAAVS